MQKKPVMLTSANGIVVLDAAYPAAGISVRITMPDTSAVSEAVRILDLMSGIFTANASSVIPTQAEISLATAKDWQRDMGQA